jgi:SAM-dependent MidA family methyltransferase
VDECLDDARRIMAARMRRRKGRGRAMTESSLPTPPPDALAHSARLTALIRAEIAAAGGSIPFERYMELALYAPGLGYYSAGATKLGADGDFITAAESSGLYAQCVAAQCREILTALGGGCVLELGAGSGALAAGMLASLEREDCLPDRYLILDRSAELRERQHETIRRRVPALANRVVWLDGPPREPMRGVIVASEVVDALPVALFRIADAAAAGAAPTSSRIEALAVASTESGFALVAGHAEPALEATVRGIESDLGRPLPPGFTSECRPALDAWIASVTEPLERGVVLCIDYGLPRREYYALERGGGTLLCHYRHRAHAHPFHAPGLEDIGAWVDFTALARAGAAAGLTLAGFTTQAHFLLGCGLEGYFTREIGHTTERTPEVAREVQRLTLPGEMGERFRVLALSRDYERPLMGFSQRDLTRTL